jgi:hypothetical protein
MKMKKVLSGLLLVALLLLGVAASGCIGGGGGGNNTSSSPSESESSSQSSYHNGGTSTPSQDHSTTGTPMPEYWRPWNSTVRIEVNGKDYWITYVKYKVSVSGSEGSGTYEIEKSRGYNTIHLYATGSNGEQKDLGEVQVFEYWGRITPIQDPELQYPVEYRIWVKDFSPETDQYFLAPMPNFAALMQGSTVGIEVKYGDSHYLWTNPASLGHYSEMPYTEGDSNLISTLAGLPVYAYWMSMVMVPLWGDVSERDLRTGGSYNEGFMGIGYSYRITPDGTVHIGGYSFWTADVEWSWSAGTVKGNGSAKISPELPAPVKITGSFAGYSGGASGQISASLQLEDIKLSESFGQVKEPESTWTPMYTDTTTTTPTTSSPPQTQTQTQPENWKRAWDASEPITIGGIAYVIKGVSYDINYKTAGGEVHYTMERGYNETDGSYVAYAVVRMDDGSTYTFQVYTDNIGEYTGWVLWVPSVFELIESGSSSEKYTVQGPNCAYTYDASGNMNGDMTCGAEITNNPFDQLWDVHNGFSGGIYGDVVDVGDISSNGNGYTVSADGTVSLSGMHFKLYNITWSGSFMGALPANGYTLVAKELPFPVEIVASITGVGRAHCTST